MVNAIVNGGYGFQLNTTTNTWGYLGSNIVVLSKPILGTTDIVSSTGLLTQLDPAGDLSILGSNVKDAR